MSCAHDLSTTTSLDVTIGVGEEWFVYCDEVVTIALTDGVVLIAGIVLSAQTEYTLRFSNDSRGIIIYSLEGGSIHISSVSSKLIALRCGSTFAQLELFSRRQLEQHKIYRILVAGSAMSGKTAVAHSLSNTFASKCPTFLLDLNPSANALFAPCTITGAEITREHILWPSETASPHRLTTSFFVDGLNGISGLNLQSFILSVRQLEVCMQYHISSIAENPYAILMDLPTPDMSVPTDLFLEQISSILHPTHILILQDVHSNSEWIKILQNNVNKTGNCQVQLLPSLSIPSTKKTSPPMLSCFIEYFGGPWSQLLGTSQIAISMQKINFYTIVNKEAVVAEEISLDKFIYLKGSVGFLSQAQLPIELPFAPISGILFISDINLQTQEIVLIVPSGESDIPGRLILIPSSLPIGFSDALSASLEHTILE